MKAAHALLGVCLGIVNSLHVLYMLKAKQILHSKDIFLTEVNSQ